jgi:hypothetical protein
MFILRSLLSCISQTATNTKHKVQRAVLLYVVVRKSVVIHKLLAGEDEALPVRGDAFLLLNLRFDGVDGVGAVGHEGDGLAGESPDEDLHATTQAKHKVQRSLLLHLIVEACCFVGKSFAKNLH